VVRRNRRRVSGLVTAVLLSGATIAAAQVTIPEACPSSPVAAMVLPACDPTRPKTCVYTSPAEHLVDRLGDIELAYDTVGMTPRTVPIRVRIPRDVPGPLPVVLWSHGGASGARNGQMKLAEWAEAVVRAGYAAINIGHRPRSHRQRAALCEALGIPPGSAPDGCEHFKFLGYDRPHDTALVIDQLPAIEAAFGIDLDEARIVVAGHSAGAGNTMMLANVGRTMGPELRYYPDERPIAFMAFSPQGPGSEGFTDDSWMAMRNVPFLTATGLGDDAGDEDPLVRRQAHYAMPPGDRYQLFVCDTLGGHGAFALAAGKTPRPYATGLVAVATAFLDTFVHGSRDAAAWLASGNAVAATAGGVEWSVR
jgi:hypothetical protein